MMMHGPFLAPSKIQFFRRKTFSTTTKLFIKSSNLGKCLNYFFLNMLIKQSFRIVGIFDLKNPSYMIRSPELVRQIAIKDFDHFTNRRKFFLDSETSLLGNSLFQMEDQRWKDMRSSLSPTFTGSKMRAMFELIRDIGEESVRFLKSTNSNELELKDFLSRYANDVIATTAFGVQINSNKDKENEFFKMGEDISTFNVFKFFFIVGFQKICKFLNFDLLPKKQNDYYMKLILDGMKYRKEHDIFRPDMINMLMEMRNSGSGTQDTKKSSKHWSDCELVAQCFLFFVAAFDTVSSTLSFICQELMENQECQDKLREEILEISESLEGKPVTYEAITSMKYADAVILEAMRKWPAVVFIDRVCTKPTVIHDPVTGKDVYIKKGDNVQLNSIGIQRDAKYFPDPMKFDPERFNEENKKNVDPSTNFSFGLGPRMCIGNRFALLEMKSILFHLFKEFKIERHEKSIVPLMKLDPSSTKLDPKGGFWVKLTKVE